MTILQKIQASLNGDWSDPETKMIALAYLAGKEAATKRICDEHSARIKKMRVAASAVRYHKLATAIIDAGGSGIIYSADYAGDVTNELCADEL